MNRQDKIAHVEEMRQAFETTPHIILASFRGVKVNDINVLRRKIGGVGGGYAVIRNRLTKRAAAGTPVEPLAAGFSGPCALATHDTDPVLLAKTLSEFAKDHPEVELLAGLVDAKVLVDAKGVKQLASLPGLPELRAQLLALIQTPATTLVRLLGTPGTQIARVIDARREAEGGGAEAEGGES